MILDLCEKTFGHNDYVFTEDDLSKNITFLETKARAYLQSIKHLFSPTQMVVKTINENKKAVDVFNGYIDLYVSNTNMVKPLVAFTNACYELGFDLFIVTLNPVTIDYEQYEMWSKFY